MAAAPTTNHAPTDQLTTGEITALRALLALAPRAQADALYDARDSEYRRAADEARALEYRLSHHPAYRNPWVTVAPPPASTQSPPLLTDALTPFTAGVLATLVVCAGLYPILRGGK